MMDGVVNFARCERDTWFKSSSGEPAESAAHWAAEQAAAESRPLIDDLHTLPPLACFGWCFAPCWRLVLAGRYVVRC
jgi:hypothetical protein